MQALWTMPKFKTESWPLRALISQVILSTMHSFPSISPFHNVFITFITTSPSFYMSCPCFFPFCLCVLGTSLYFHWFFFLHNIIGLRYRSPLDCSRSTYSYTPCSTPWSPNTPTYYIPLSFQFLSCLHSSSHSNSLSPVQSTASSRFFPAVLKPQCSSLALARAFANKWHLCSVADVEPPRYKLVCL